MSERQPTPFEVVTKVLAAMQRGDMDTIMAGIHPDVEVHEAESVPFYPGVYRGRDAFLHDVMQPMATAYELDLHDVRVLDAGDTVIGLVDLGLTSRQTGRTVRMPLVEVYTVKDGLINRLDVYYKDTAKLVEAFPEGIADRAPTATRK